MQHLGSSNRIGRDTVNERTNHLIGQRFELGTSNRTANQRVLQNAQVNALLTRLSAQLGHAAYLDAPIFGDDEGLCSYQLGSYSSDDCLFIFDIETQGLSPRLK